MLSLSRNMTTTYNKKNIVGIVTARFTAQTFGTERLTERGVAAFKLNTPCTNQEQGRPNNEQQIKANMIIVTRQLEIDYISNKNEAYRGDKKVEKLTTETGKRTNTQQQALLRCKRITTTQQWKRQKYQPTTKRRIVDGTRKNIEKPKPSKTTTQPRWNRRSRRLPPHWTCRNRAARICRNVFEY